MKTDTETAPRRRNAADSRERLLAAAGALFAERGYEATTVREIGQQAGVDPTLIARYFGSKAALYLAAIRPNASTGPLDISDGAVMQGMLERVGASGPTPTLYAAVRPHADAELQQAAMDLIATRMLQPAREAAAGHDDAGLRAEITVAALAGIMLTRSAHTFPALSTAAPEELGPLMAQLFTSLLGHRPTA